MPPRKRQSLSLSIDPLWLFGVVLTALIGTGIALAVRQGENLVGKVIELDKTMAGVVSFNKEMHDFQVRYDVNQKTIVDNQAKLTELYSSMKRAQDSACTASAPAAPATPEYEYTPAPAPP